MKVLLKDFMNFFSFKSKVQNLQPVFESPHLTSAIQVDQVVGLKIPDLIQKFQQILPLDKSFIQHGIKLQQPPVGILHNGIDIRIIHLSFQAPD